MKKLFFSLIAICLFSFANAAGNGPYSSVKIINNSGFDLKLDIGARDQATAVGTTDFTLSNEEVANAANLIVVATTVDPLAEYIVYVTVVEVNGDVPDSCDRGDVDLDGSGTFEYDNEMYLLTFSCIGSQAIMTITKQ